jgi:HK97 gp10 family phage protein
MIETTFDIKGFKELDEALKQFPIKLQKNILKDATKEGAKVIQRAAIAMCPVKTGHLSRGIKVRVGKKRKDQYTVTYIIGLLKKVFYGRYVEYGTGAHFIKIKNKKVLTTKDVVLGTEVHHPGAKMKPFMRPAIDNYAGQAIDAIKNKLIQGIEKNLPVIGAEEDA